jgi:hypothetical protein
VRAHRARVGAGVRLGEAEAADRLARVHRRQPALLLLLGAPAPDRDIASEPWTETRCDARVAGLELEAGQPVGDALAPGSRSRRGACRRGRASRARRAARAAGCPCSNQSPTSGSTRSRRTARTVSRIARSSSSRARRARGSRAGRDRVVLRSWSPRWVPPSVGTTMIVARAVGGGQIRDRVGIMVRGAGRCAVSTIARGRTHADRQLEPVDAWAAPTPERCSSSTSRADDDRRRGRRPSRARSKPRRCSNGAPTRPRMEQPHLARRDRRVCCSARKRLLVEPGCGRASSISASRRRGRRRRFRGVAAPAGAGRPVRARAADGRPTWDLAPDGGYPLTV